jgi:hypothetical protein
MPRITADEARAMSETSVVELVHQAWDRIRDVSPFSRSVTLTRADNPAWATFLPESREKLEEVARILRSDGFEVSFYSSGSAPRVSASTVISWRSPN